MPSTGVPPPLVIRNALVVLPGEAVRVDIRCQQGAISAIGHDLALDGATLLDATGLTAGPGFIDIHVHGGGGHSFFEGGPAAVRQYREWAPRHGVTAFLVSTLGRDHAATTGLLRSLAPVTEESSGAQPLGIHLEGPFLNPARRGAFPAGMLRSPDAVAFAEFQEAAGGAIRQVTLAPELPGAEALIRAIVDSRAVAAMGHTDATAAEARKAFDQGITHVTHLFNAMRPIHQRDAGPAIAALLDARVTCELICDHAHVAPEMLALAHQSLGPTRTAVVTDNLDLAGLPPRSGSFAGDVVRAEGARALRADGTIVGSLATMDEHFRNAARIPGSGVADAFACCSTTPARVAGVGHHMGAVALGMAADIVLLDADLRVHTTICRGAIVFQAA